tara:strand:+ start:26 stop:529 length:504 start_codon:yes stop_codon:yes gene_type:complete
MSKNLAIGMGEKRYYSYDGKKAWTGIGSKVLVDDGWIDAVNGHFANNGYDDLLAVVGRILRDAGFTDISRAQAWVITQDVLNGGVPEILRDNDVDESIGKGHMMYDIAQKAMKGVVDTTVAAGTVASNVATGTVDMGKKAVGTVTGAVSDEPMDLTPPSEESPSTEE